MKGLIVICFIFCLFSEGYGQKKPAWVTERPVNTMYYTGIGMALKTEKDYMQKAKQNALSDLVSEIKVEVSSNSLLSTLENNGEVKSDFEETIRLGAKEEIENFQLVENWQSETEYWVYYQLNKFDYEEYMEKRREKAIKQGFDYWYKGQESLRQGDLMVALELFLKGLDVIQPVVNDELTCSYEDKTMDVGRELYSSLKGIFSGMTIYVSPKTLEGQAFQAIETPVLVKVERKGVPLRNLRLKCVFVEGAGQLSQNTTTDDAGEMELRILNVTSKASKQEVAITMDEALFRPYESGIYAGLIQTVKNSGPEAIVNVNIGQNTVNAFFKVTPGSDESVLRAVQGILTRNYFNIVASPSKATVIVSLSTDFRKGEKVDGEMYNMIAYYSGVGIKIADNGTGAEVLNYDLADVKTLLSEKTAPASARSAAVRELVKRINRDLPRQLKNLNISGGTGAIEVTQEQEPEPAPAPEPEVKPSKPVVVVTPPSKSGTEGEIVPGVFVRYVGMKQLTDRTLLEFKIMNKTDEDYRMTLSSNQKVINEKGEEVRIEKLKLGSDENLWQVDATIIPEVSTTLLLTTRKMKSVMMVQLKDGKGMVKLRNLE